jgi:hypothetical protein
MGDLTRAQLRSAVAASLGNRTDINASIDNWLNFAQRYIARRHDFRELRIVDEVTVIPVGVPATDKTYSLGVTNLKEIYALLRQVGTDIAVKLTNVPNRQWQQLVGKPDAMGTGDAMWYTQYGNSVEFSPVPAQQFTLVRHYSKWPTLLTSDSQVSDYTNKDEIIIARATHEAFQSLGMLEDAGRWFSIADDLMDMAIKEDNYRPDEVFVARGVSEESSGPSSDPWADPFVKSTRVQ